MAVWASKCNVYVLVFIHKVLECSWNMGKTEGVVFTENELIHYEKRRVSG